MKPCGYAVVCPCQHFITQNITKWPFSFMLVVHSNFPSAQKWAIFHVRLFGEICNATSLTAKVAAASFLWADTPTGITLALSMGLSWSNQSGFWWRYCCPWFHSKDFVPRSVRCNSFFFPDKNTTWRCPGSCALFYVSPRIIVSFWTQEFNKFYCTSFWKTRKSVFKASLPSDIAIAFICWL